MKTTSHKVSDSLFLVHQVLDKNAPVKAVETPVNHIAVIDCSGSMWDALPKIREQLKKKLPKLLKEKDTISIIWFSGRNQFGTLLEAEPVATLSDLSVVNQSIDRWLNCVGLTGFKEPLDEVSSLVKRVSKKNPDSSFSLFFMSDGCDNQWSRADILKSVENAAGVLSSAVFVEYGYYADRPLLAAMAEKAGGTLIFSEDFDKYAPLFEAAMQKKISGAPRVKVQIKGDPVGGFAFALSDGDLLSYEASTGEASVSQDLNEIWYLSPTKIGDAGRDLIDISKDCSDSKSSAKDLGSVNGAYAAVSLFSVRMLPDVVLPLLKSIGDVQFIEKFSSCFGKQKYSEFMDAAKSAAFNDGRFLKGWDPKKVPNDDAFTVLEMLSILAEDEDNKVLLDHPSFKYGRISRARVDSSTVLTADEQTEVANLSAEMTKTKDVKKIAELSSRIAAISNKPVPLKFDFDPAPDGYSVNNLVYSEEFPNVSIQTRRTGSVDISGRLPDNLKSVLSAKFPSFVYRNYAIVKDGLVNVEVLPVKLSAKTLEKLFEVHKKGLVADDVVQSEGNVTLINFRSLPVVNRRMVKSVSAEEIFEQEWNLLKIQAIQKVYNSVLKEAVGTKKSEGFVEQYGKEAADWLRDQGFTDYSGFGPKMVQADAKDFYMAKQLSISAKGYSSLPSMKDARDKIAKGKPNGPTLLMQSTIKEVDDFLSSPAYTKATDKEKAFESWVKPLQKASDRTRRDIISEKARQVFSIVVGQVWFKEFKSLDENTLTMKCDGQDIIFKADMAEKKIEL